MSKSKYALRMARLSERIFGEVSQKRYEKSWKVFKTFNGLPAHLDPEVVKYYPRHRELFTLMNGLRYHGLYRDEAADFKKEMTRRLEVRGRLKATPESWMAKKRESLERRELQEAGIDKSQNITES